MSVKSRCLAIVVAVAVESACCHAGSAERFRYFKENVQTKDTGVYEHGEDLYVHVRLPTADSASLTRNRMKAVCEINDLLRRWAIGHASANRNVGRAGIGIGMATLANVLDKANPLWRCGDWNYRAGGQEFTGSGGGWFWLCNVVDRRAVVRQIPQSLYNADPSTNLAFRAMQTLLPAMLKSDAGRLYSDLGVVDLHDIPPPDASVSEEANRVAAAIESYLASSNCVEMTARRRRLSAGEVRVSQTDVPAACDEKRTENVLVITNVQASVAVVTNETERSELPRERLSLGISARGMVREEVRQSDVGEVVETRTVTIVSTRKTIRRKTETMVFGSPRFEEVFLSGGTMTNAPVAQVASGVEAARLYCRANVSLAERERAVRDALCENPGDVQMWNMYGRCLLRRGDDLGALVSFRAAAGIDRNDQYALTNLADAYERLGCHRLACGYAILGIALSKDGWCQEKCRSIFMK